MSEKYKVDKINAIMEESAGTDSLVQVTDWINGEGYDITITSKNGGMQHLSITWLEFDVIKKAIKKLGKIIK